jgi:hypothetical protein
VIRKKNDCGRRGGQNECSDAPLREEIRVAKGIISALCPPPVPLGNDLAGPSQVNITKRLQILGQTCGEAAEPIPVSAEKDTTERRDAKLQG